LTAHYAQAGPTTLYQSSRRRLHNSKPRQGSASRSDYYYYYYYIKVIKETCTTWDSFKDYLTKHKTARDLADATRLCKEIGYIPSLFQTLYLV
jgi:hypothetical protein